MFIILASERDPKDSWRRNKSKDTKKIESDKWRKKDLEEIKDKKDLEENNDDEVLKELRNYRTITRFIIKQIIDKRSWNSKNKDQETFWHSQSL